MRMYLMSVVGIVLISTILTTIIPKGKNANMIYGVAKIICLLVIISPILQFFQNKGNAGFDKIYQEFFSDSVIETDAGFIKYYSESTIAYFEKELEKEILEKYNLSVSISLHWEYEQSDFQGIYPDLKIKITQICVSTEENIKEEDKKRLNEFLISNYCSEVLIE